jgi:hypothetical protein
MEFLSNAANFVGKQQVVRLGFEQVKLPLGFLRVLARVNAFFAALTIPTRHGGVGRCDQV